MDENKEVPATNESKVEESEANKTEVTLKALPVNPDPSFAAYATNYDITKLSNHKLNAIVASRSSNKKKFVKCGFCGKYDRLGAYNCTKCNSTLMNDTIINNLLNDQDNQKTGLEYEKTDEFLDCCDICMNNFMYGCIYLSIFAVLFIFPLFEIINIGTHWNNYGGCSVYFQYLLLSKLLITIFLYSLVAVHIFIKKMKLNKMFILCTGMILFFVWLIVASISFWSDDNFDHDHCNAHDEFTAGYYDFMYIEIMLVWTVFAFIISYLIWITIAKHEKLIRGIVYGQVCMITICLPTAIPICEIIMLILFWNNHGHCSDQFEWYILVKVVFILFVSLVSFILFFYFKTFDNAKIRSIVVNLIIGVVFLFLFVWGIMAAGMFFDKEAYDHDLCNHDSMHTAIYYDWMFVEIILNFAVLYLAGNVVLCFILAGYLCGKKKKNGNNNVVQTGSEIELQRV